MLAGVFPVQGEMPVVVFHTPIFILLMAGLAALSLACCWKRKGRTTLRNAGFQLTHLGTIVILAGALTGFLAAKNSEFAVPVSGNHEIRQIPAADDNSSYDLDFGISVTNFQVDFYEQLDRRLNPTPKHFQASLRITAVDGSTSASELEVNHPAEHAGWRFYLMSYDTDARRYVVLNARKDPGRKIVFTGIAMLMTGISILCWRKTGVTNAAS